MKNPYSDRKLLLASVATSVVLFTHGCSLILAGLLTEPTFFPAPGTFSGPVQVTISAEAGSQIYYTLDGTVPGPANGSIYGSQITVAATTTIKAMAVKDGFDDSFVASAKFVVAPALLITEVGSCPFINISCWLEVYNSSGSPVSLSSYQLRVQTRSRLAPYAITGVRTFPLPFLVIQPGAYALVRGRNSDDWADGQHAAYIVDGSGSVPDWGSWGFVEMLSAGVTADFVRFGGDTTNPTSSGAWTGVAAPALPSGSGNYGFSVARNGSNTDTDGDGDWFYRTFATPGGPNDVTSAVDSDADGIPDSSEQPGGTFAGLPLYDWGARTGQRDIFIHIDHMASGDEAVTPRQEALDDVVSAFLSQGIAVHLDVGSLFDPAPGANPASHDLDDKDHTVPVATGVTLGEPFDGRANVYEYKYLYMDVARKQVFHYAMFGTSQEVDGSCGSGGRGEIKGNDFLVSLGGCGLNSSDGASTNRLINAQSTTFMHELGHNLGLRHGGDENVNYKTNYVSIMNYMYSFEGLPTIGASEGDRYFNFVDPFTYPLSGLTNSPYTGTFIIDYSHGVGGSLNEISVVESQGLRYPGSSPVDFNDDSDNLDTLFLDLNQDFLYTVLTDHDDWDVINLFFFRNYSGDAAGPAFNGSGSFTWVDVVGDDRQPIYPDDDFRLPLP